MTICKVNGKTISVIENKALYKFFVKDRIRTLKFETEPQKIFDIDKAYTMEEK